jgi:hypothetical protein
MQKIAAALIAKIIVTIPVWSASAENGCPSTNSKPGYFFVGSERVNVPAKYGSVGSRFIVVHSPSVNDSDTASGCNPKPRHFDLAGLPLGTELPETVNPDLRNGGGGLPGDARWSTAILYALPASPAALEMLRHLGDSKLVPPTAWDDHRATQSETNSLSLHLITSGPYKHYGVSGSYLVDPNQAKQPNGDALGFTCDPGSKWTYCAVNYALVPGLGLQYSRYFNVINYHDKEWQSNLVKEMIKSDGKIRTAALTFLPTR